MVVAITMVIVCQIQLVCEVNKVSEVLEVSWKDKKIKTNEEKIKEEKDALPLRCVPIGRIQIEFKQRLGANYTKLYKRRPGFDGITTSIANSFASPSHPNGIFNARKDSDSLQTKASISKILQEMESIAPIITPYINAFTPSEPSV